MNLRFDKAGALKAGHHPQVIDAFMKKNNLIAMTIPPDEIQKYEKLFNATITQKPYAEGMKEHGMEAGEKKGPAGWIDRFSSLSDKKKITLYTKDLCKSTAYHSMFHELQHASSMGYSDKDAEAYADRQMQQNKIIRGNNCNASDAKMKFQTKRFLGNP